MRAKLIGGPKDGAVVDVVGQVHEVRCVLPRCRSDRRIASAMYAWQVGERGGYFGLFLGYFNGNVRLRRDGSRMPLQRKGKKHG